MLLRHFMLNLNIILICHLFQKIFSFLMLKCDINIVRKQCSCFPYSFKILRCQHPIVSRIRCVGIFRKRIHQINVLLVIADNDSIVRISRNPDENDDWISLRQSLLQRVNAPMTSLCLIPMSLKNIHDAVCGNEAKRSF